jgi:Leucine-rich repeat (LRR) protein
VFNLSLGYNNLHGYIPTSIGNLTNLNALDFHNNQLTGSIPTSIGNLTNLTYLAIDANDLEGHIPSYIGNFTNLVYLDLQGNEFSEVIPWELGRLTGLIFLDISSNHLTGVDSFNIGATCTTLQKQEGNTPWYQTQIPAIPTDPCAGSALPDLAIELNVTDNWTNVTVMNVGDAPARDFCSNLYLNSNCNPNTIGDYENCYHMNLNPYPTPGSAYTWSKTGTPNSACASVDRTNVIPESNENNNQGSWPSAPTATRERYSVESAVFDFSYPHLFSR